MLYKILCVDDETANLRLLERLFRGSYEVVNAGGGGEALELLAVHDIALIISDQRMPGMTGIEFLNRASELRPQTVRIMLTGYTDTGTLVEAINSGLVYKYVTKPWNNEDLVQTVKRSLQHYETMKAQRQLQLQNERLQSRLKATCDAFVEVVGSMLDLKDPRARDHADRTSTCAASIGEALKLERHEIVQLSLAAFLHEAAFFNIPNSILEKESPLTAEEFQIVNRHLETGVQMIASVPDLTEIAAILRFHYENYDGSGQPEGFSSEQIPLHARIIAVADAFDSMTVPRAMRSAMSHEEALRSLLSESGRRFDPEIVKVLCDTRRRDMVQGEEIELIAI